MIVEKEISDKIKDIPSLDYDYLRKKGIQHIQQLSGKIWTDFNLHDPGITILEILCYALTDAGYRIELLKEAFKSKDEISKSFAQKYLFSPEDLLSTLPITCNDLEAYVEKLHPKVILSWVKPIPVMEVNEVVKGNYEVSVYLEPDAKYQDLNSDVVVIQISPSKKIQIILFDQNNIRFSWSDINQVDSVSLASGKDTNFFQFEIHNAQVPLDLKLKRRRKKQFENTTAKARINLISIDETISENVSIKRYESDILKLLESKEFVNRINQLLQKEHYKRDLLHDIKKSLLPVRGLCEDFKSFKVVQIQEVKCVATIGLEVDARDNNTMLQEIFNYLDNFLLQMVKKFRSEHNRDKKNVLYTSNLIEAITNIHGVKTVQIERLNLFVDGIPTISLQDEGALDCLQFQNFSRLIPRISREKSAITFIRQGIKKTLHISEVSDQFTTRSMLPENFQPEISVPFKVEATNSVLSSEFLDGLGDYISIQEDLPKNYHLMSGNLPKEVPETIIQQQKRIKSYILFYDRLLLGYMKRIEGFCDQLRFVRDQENILNDDDTDLNSLPDVANLNLLAKNYKSRSLDKNNDQKNLNDQNKILDHLLARFATSYLDPENNKFEIAETLLESKIRLLKNLPEITRERGLGLPLHVSPKNIWGSPILSGFQKRIYHLMGIADDFMHNQLTKKKGKEPHGFYLVEHLLLLEKTEYHVYDKKLNKAATLLKDYLLDLASDEEKNFRYSATISILIPNWFSKWNNNRPEYERIINSQVPAHIAPNIYWVNRKSLEGFEILYEDWINGLFKVYE